MNDKPVYAPWQPPKIQYSPATWPSWIVYEMKDGSQEAFLLRSYSAYVNERSAAAIEVASKGTLVDSYFFTDSLPPTAHRN